MLTVYPHVGNVIASVKAQQRALALVRLVYINRTAIPHRFMLFVNAYSARLVLIRKRHVYLFAEFNFSARQVARNAVGVVVKLEFPFAVEHNPVVATELRSRVIVSGWFHDKINSFFILVRIYAHAHMYVGLKILREIRRPQPITLFVEVNFIGTKIVCQIVYRTSVLI